MGEFSDFDKLAAGWGGGFPGEKSIRGNLGTVSVLCTEDLYPSSGTGAETAESSGGWF